MQILTIACQKGGVGKTTTAAALTQAAAYRGKRVLGIDLDAQANYSFALGFTHSEERNSFRLLNGEPAERMIQRTPQGIDLIAADINLAALKSERGSARRLQEALKPIVSDYDIVIVDTPPTAGELQYNALQAATDLLVPLETDTYCLQALYQMNDTARMFQKSNPALRISGFILTKYDARSTLAKQLQQMIADKAANMGIPYLGTIRKSVSVSEAAALQQSLFEYAPKCKPAQDYMELFSKIFKEA